MSWKMIEVLDKQGKTIQLRRLSDFKNSPDNVVSLQLVNSSESDLKDLSVLFNINTEPFQKRDEIEISSQYVELPDQLSLNLTLLYFDSSHKLQKGVVHIIVKKDFIITILSSKLRRALNLFLTQRSKEFITAGNGQAMLLKFLEKLTDYYADLIEFTMRTVSKYYEKVMEIKTISDHELDNLTQIKFTNIQLKESLIELQKIVLLMRRSQFIDSESKQILASEAGDLAVINEHIQYNFDRLNDLKENISSKINLEQNRIMKMFTVFTIVFAPPTLIAGIYGMNFKFLPELDWSFGYPFAILLMFLSSSSILIYFKLKRWI